MKFFTRAWASGELTDAEMEEARDAYWRSVEEAQSRWPEGVVLLARTNLHDARLESGAICRVKRSLQLVMLAGDLSTGYSRVTITYSDMEVGLLDIEVLRNRLADPSTEVLYDEVGDVDTRRYAHRILLSPAGELCIVFSAVAIGATPASRRDRQDLAVEGHVLQEMQE